MNIYIWGTGRLVGKVVGQYIELSDIKGFVDSNHLKTEYMGKKVYKPIDMLAINYDAIVVANLYAEEIRAESKRIGLDEKKIIYLYNNCLLSDMNEDYGFVEKILGKQYADIVRKRHYIIRGVEAYGDLCFKDSPFLEKGYLETDYVRSKCFELAVKEMRKRNVQGAVAEVGVFRGEFAQYINYAFADRKCYLFDTFEGFNADEAISEVRSGHCTPAFVEAYKDTNLKQVLDRMLFMDNIVIKQGYFPDSLNGLEENFAFVSVDVDFDDSIYECLKYFYPRLSKGGYIFVHDYNSDLKGVEKAVDRYEKDMDVWLCKVAICDKSGTLVITK